MTGVQMEFHGRIPGHAGAAMKSAITPSSPACPGEYPGNQDRTWPRPASASWSATASALPRPDLPGRRPQALRALFLEVDTDGSLELRRHSFEIPDMNIPSGPELMRGVLDLIRAELEAGDLLNPLLGRHRPAGTAVGCWLREAGLDPDSALARAGTLRIPHGSGETFALPHSPQQPRRSTTSELAGRLIPARSPHCKEPARSTFSSRGARQESAAFPMNRIQPHHEAFTPRTATAFAALLAACRRARGGGPSIKFARDIRPILRMLLQVPRSRRSGAKGRPERRQRRAPRHEEGALEDMGGRSPWCRAIPRTAS